jgi:hypothetical protein
MMKPGIAIAIGILMSLAAATPSWAQSPPETGDYFQQGDSAPLFLDPKACADGGRSTVGSGDIVEPGDEALTDELATMGSTVCPPPEIDPDIRSPILSNPGHWGHRPN